MRKRQDRRVKRHDMMMMWLHLLFPFLVHLTLSLCDLAAFCFTKNFCMFNCSVYYEKRQVFSCFSPNCIIMLCNNHVVRDRDQDHFSAFVYDSLPPQYFYTSASSSKGKLSEGNKNEDEEQKKVCLFVSHIFFPFVLHHNKTEKYESTRHNGLIFYIRLDISPSAKLVWLMILLLYSFFSVIFHISLFYLCCRHQPPPPP